MMGVTDKLIMAAENAALGNDAGSRTMREKLYGLHARTVEDLLFDAQAQSKLKDYVEQVMQESFDVQVAAIAEKGELEPHRMDAMAAIGETLSNTMMAQYLSSPGTSSDTVYADQDFIKTTADAGGASADIDASVPLIRAKLVSVCFQLSNFAPPLVRSLFSTHRPFSPPAFSWFLSAITHPLPYRPAPCRCPCWRLAFCLA
jgi:aspartokinase